MLLSYNKEVEEFTILYQKNEGEKLQLETKYDKCNHI